MEIRGGVHVHRFYLTHVRSASRLPRREGGAEKETGAAHNVCFEESLKFAMNR